MNIFKKLSNHLVGSFLLSYTDLVCLVNSGVIDAPLDNINGSSIDVTLHNIVRKETIGPSLNIVRLNKGESIETHAIDITGIEFSNDA